jgi:glycine cleavage system H protein
MILRGFEFPDDLHYLVEHDVWARLHDDGTATVGITALGIRLSGEIYMCRPKDVGMAVEQGRAVAVVELAKAIVSVKSAVSGEVIETNPLLASTPEIVHLDPYGNGWIARLRLRGFAADSTQLAHGESVAAVMEHHAWLNNVEHA